jgi:septum formation protein
MPGPRLSSVDHNLPAAGVEPVLLLASGSPRRRELLAQIGVPHAVVVPGIEELRLAGEGVGECLLRLALAKARAGHAVAQERSAHLGQLPVLGADTAVVLGADMLGKPVDRDDALAMLARLSDTTHRVLTAVALVHAGGEATRLCESRVRFRALTAPECAAYWESGEPRDKAGAYAVQGLGAVFISALEGSYSGVMGLPLYETAELLDAAGVPRWRSLEA